MHEPGNSTDDGCIQVTAGRDEEPDATTVLDHKSDSAGNIQTPEEAHGMPSYPRDSEDDKAHSLPSTRRSSGEPETVIDTPAQDNDSVD